EDICFSRYRHIRVPKCDWYEPRMYKLQDGRVFYARRGSEGLQTFRCIGPGHRGQFRAALVEQDFDDVRQMCRGDEIPYRFQPELGDVGVVAPQDPPPAADRQKQTRGPRRISKVQRAIVILKYRAKSQSESIRV